MGNLVIVSFVIPIVLAATAGILAVMDANKAPRHKRLVRVFEACIAWYFVLSYSLALASSLSLLTNDGLLYAIRSGLLTRFGVVLLLIWLIADIVASRRGERAAGTD